MNCSIRSGTIAQQHCGAVDPHQGGRVRHWEQNFTLLVRRRSEYTAFYYCSIGWDLGVAVTAHRGTHTQRQVIVLAHRNAQGDPLRSIQLHLLGHAMALPDGTVSHVSQGRSPTLRPQCGRRSRFSAPPCSCSTRPRSAHAAAATRVSDGAPCCVQSYCVEGQQDTPMCVADEHYLPTVLNAYGMDASVDHLGQLTYVNWEHASWHPMTFYPGNVTDYASRMRTQDGAARCAAFPLPYPILPFPPHPRPTLPPTSSSHSTADALNP